MIPRRVVLGTLLALLLAPLCGATSGARSLDSYFAAAKRAPSAIVPLILEASRAIPEQPTAKGHAIAERLKPYLQRVFFGPETIPEMEQLGVARHQVKAGDRPSKIARRYRIDTELLSALNADYDDRKLKPGMRLKVIDLSDRSLRLVVDRKHFRIALWRSVTPGGQGAKQHVLIGYFQIACGSKATPTPVGSTRIAAKTRNPSWRDPKTKHVYGPHDKKNVLGGYWLGLDSKRLGTSGIGIHGYSGSAPKNWIGKPVSHGCIRLLKADIDRVFRLARVGTPVKIY